MYSMDTIMKCKDSKVKEEPCDYDADFKILTKGEKRLILKSAKTLLEVQKKDAEMLNLAKMKC